MGQKFHYEFFSRGFLAAFGEFRVTVRHLALSDGFLLLSCNVQSAALKDLLVHLETLSQCLILVKNAPSVLHEIYRD